MRIPCAEFSFRRHGWLLCIIQLQGMFLRNRMLRQKQTSGSRPSVKQRSVYVVLHVQRPAVLYHLHLRVYGHLQLYLWYQPDVGDLVHLGDKF